jgi:hypothetical protein
MPRDFDRQLPIFNWKDDGGVLFPYFPISQLQTDANLRYANFDASASAVLARVKFPFPVYFVTCDAIAVSDDQGVKSGAATIEPILHMVYGTAGLVSIDAGTEIALITCDGAGAIGKVWEGTTTPTRVETTEEIIIALKTAAAGDSTSTLYDGGGVIRMWLAQINTP